MRLLQLQNGVLSLTKNFDDDIPPYAILSHTWGEDDQEVTLRDVVQGKAKGKEGYRKIQFCGKQATSDGLHYFWVDACCIDKSSSAELQESLNSMFRWYQNAAKCYVYLADVPRKAEVDDLRRADWKLDLRTSRWFRRGWTLQELLAPSIVDFYSSNGERLGDKTSLESLLSEITEIPAPALRNNQLSTFSVEERMLWIKHRDTKKAEDMAYSLFGIFDVQIPLLYGEGKEKAFGRLRREIDNHDYQTRVVSKLPIAYGAAFDSHAEEHNPTCLKGTRVELLSQISKWADDPQTEALFWLNGMAGTGKSTISRTLASSHHVDGRLAASFFFKKGEADRGGVSKFFTTIAAQLARYIPATAQHIHSNISADPAIVEKAMPVQFEKLILQPLIASRAARLPAPSNLIIVDALDECEVEKDMTLIIKLFSDTRRKAPGLKVFITSRPELPIRLGFKATKGAYDKVILHEIADSVIKHDIAAFLAHGLEQIRYDYNESVEEQERQLPATWPTQQDSQDLVKMTVPLFISAATVCLFIADRVGGNPRKKLEKILMNKARAQGSKLDTMYLIVLEQLLAGLSDKDSQEVLAQFRKVVGSIVVLATPLSPSALARLLELPIEDVSDLLDLLHSVLSVPSSSKQPIRLLHLSFRDFLLDPKRSEIDPFWIDQEKAHKQLATDCFRILKKSLRNDICGIRHPGTEHSSIDPEKISTMLPDEVRYACEHWAYHLRESGEDVLDGGEVHTFLSEHFLRWLEALSLIRRLSQSSNTIRIVRNLMPAKDNSLIARFLDDAIRFIFGFGQIIHQAPLQVYSSALIFAPRNSIIRLSFENQISGWISLKPKVPPNWSSNMQLLEGHKAEVVKVVFSPNSKFVASYSWDGTIKLWAADLGTLLQTLKDHGQMVESFGFFPDGEILGSVSSDGAIRLWDVNTGALLQTRDIQFGPVGFFSAVFSSDMKLLVTASCDKLVRIWVTGTGALQRTLDDHENMVNVTSVAFSSDAALVVASSNSHKVLVWETDTGTLLHVITDLACVHSGVDFPADSVSFSPNSKLVAFRSENSMEYTVRIWDTNTEALLQTLYNDDIMDSVSFSPDSKLVAIASCEEIQLWDVDTGVMQQVLNGHREDVLSVKFSPDGKLVASGSQDGTLRLWDANIDAPLETDYDDFILSLSLSSDKKIVASVSGDGTVRLRDTYSGTLQCTLEAHSAPIVEVTLSPDGRTVASSSKDGTVRLWAVDTGALRHTCKDCTGNSILGTRPFAFSADSKLFALATSSNILLWAVDTGSLLLYHEWDPSRWTHSLVFSPDSKLLASVSPGAMNLYSTVPVSASSDGTVEPCSLVIHRTLKGPDIRSPSGHGVFSPDGMLLALPWHDKDIRLWAIGSGELRHTLEGHRTTVNEVAFSPDSKCVASASDDETVRLWETGTGMLCRVIEIGFPLKCLKFLSTNKLQTNAGIITVDKPNTEPFQYITPVLRCGHNSFSGFGMSFDHSWVTLNGRNLIWLPPEFRPTLSPPFVFGSTVVIDCKSEIIVMRFSEDEFRRYGVVN
ncbi:unnamed protein product [Clonostachys rhizophaga]|uniref:Vegetative incompatibility protein HET-E-1 n=1 Tax=Clonostachys rhizophaga TaxID=160324 RepID=A0A9N9VEN2_9HYPO|nr:unnamed protein product [Clonostachys rhizophaga]